ncbi:MAG: glutamate--tRNA ligase [Saezia sp.]
MTTVRTRFAPSPTGFIHLGNIRSALYPWAFARASKGVFVLRIEDTDLERSSEEAVQVILEGMEWLGLNPDEGPFYQMQRMDYYKDMLGKMVQAGTVYPCYMSVEELDALRERQQANKEKPRYDGTWRPEPGKVLPVIPEGVEPVWRFKNPLDGTVVWEDKVKGRIEIANAELDDFVVARKDMVPTYNFCVVLDDIAMNITHVIRGDDHVNNTPRQINLFRALGIEPPIFAHLPTVLNEQGEKMSKRNGAKPVTQYREEGFLPDAVVNYLARLGWSHGNDEIFSQEQLVEWFDLDHLGKSAGHYDEAKLRWVNAQHIKMTDDMKLAEITHWHLEKMGVQADERLTQICTLFKSRCETMVDMANAAKPYYQDVVIDDAVRAEHVSEEIKPAMHDLANALDAVEWSKELIFGAFKQVMQKHNLKMPKIGAPARVLVLGTPGSPSIDEVFALMDKAIVINRLRKA